MAGKKKNKDKTEGEDGTTKKKGLSVKAMGNAVLKRGSSAYNLVKGSLSRKKGHARAEAADKGQDEDNGDVGDVELEEADFGDVDEEEEEEEEVQSRQNEQGELDGDGMEEEEEAEEKGEENKKGLRERLIAQLLSLQLQMQEQLDVVLDLESISIADLRKELQRLVQSATGITDGLREQMERMSEEELEKILEEESEEEEEMEEQEVKADGETSAAIKLTRGEFVSGCSATEFKKEEMAEVDAMIKEKKLPNAAWCNGDASGFRLRVGPDYKKNKKKDTSAPALYDLVAFDLIRDKSSKIYNYAEFAKLPPPRDVDDLEMIKDSGLPRLIVVNSQVPYKSGKMFGTKSKSNNEDPGCSIAFVFAIKPETVREALSSSARPAVKLLKRFVNEWDTNEDIRRRMKAMGYADNIKDLKISGTSLVERYNGKPVIIYKTGRIYARRHEYLEVEIKIDEFSYLAKKGLDAFRHRLREIQLRCAFVIQGEPDEELPEILFGCAFIRGLALEDAMEVHYGPHLE